MLSRRALVVFGGGFALAADEFWNNTKPAEWSEKDIQRLLTHSPWTKQVTVDMHLAGAVGGEPVDRSAGRGGRGGGSGEMTAESGGLGGGGAAMGGRGGGRGRSGDDTAGGGMQNRPEVKAIVRWESARPVRDAIKKELPKELAESYLISVTGVRLNGRGDDAGLGNEVVERLKKSVQLQRKGSDPIFPSRVEIAGAQQGPVAFFLFPRGSQPIQASDREVIFHLSLGRMEVKAKFPLKEMLYHGELAL